MLALALLVACTDPLAAPDASVGPPDASRPGPERDSALVVADAAPPLDGIPVNEWIARETPPLPLSPGLPNKHLQSVYDSTRHAIYFYGGDYCVGDRCASHERIFRYDVATDTWDVVLDAGASTTAGSPRGRCLAALAYDPVRDAIWMHSGQERHSEYATGLESGGLWAFAVAEQRWIRHGVSIADRETQPSVYEVNYMHYDAANDALFQPYALSRVARFRLGELVPGARDAWEQLDGLPTEEYLTGNVSFAIDTRRDRAVFYLGESGETWAYDLRTGASERLSAERLRPWSVFGLAYSSADDAFVIFGGLDGYEGVEGVSYGNELYVLDGGSSDWRPLALGGDVPTPRKGDNLVYDAYNDVFVVYGGTGGFQGIGERDAGGYDGTEIFLLRLRDP
jgi:hypothetical protein